MTHQDNEEEREGMTDSKTCTRCGKPLVDGGTHTCRVTDSKTAREWAKQTELIIECYDGLDGGRASREETRKVLEKAFTDYASDRLNFELRGYRQLTSLYEKKINELEAEVAKWKDSSDGWRKMCHKAEAELTSLKSSLAEKEKIEREADTFAQQNKLLLETGLGLQAQLASLKKENERIKSDSSSGLSVKYKLELLKQIWKLQLENEVMSSGLTDIRGIHHNCGQCNCALTSGESQCETYQVADKALSTSTKSSLMEKVRAFIQIFDGQTEPLHPISWMAALTEVKKEIGV